MSSEKSEIEVRHNTAENRFEAVVQGELSVADYERDGDKIIFTHTYVPSVLRGRGIAEKLVRAALQYAQDEKLRVVPACSYVSVFIGRHQEYKPLLA